MAEEENDSPDTDGCAIDFVEHADDEETASLRPLFPDGNPETADAWKALFASETE